MESAAGFELALELTVKAHALGLQHAEVPTPWRDRTAGESRFRLTKWLPHYLRWYRYGMRTRLRRRGFPPRGHRLAPSGRARRPGLAAGTARGALRACSNLGPRCNFSATAGPSIFFRAGQR